MTDPVDEVMLKTLAVGDIVGGFFVTAYQRGYRWGEQEVLQLIDDVRESNGANYYLQPLVVKHRDDDSWELVDGQQRLTTLSLVPSTARMNLWGGGPDSRDWRGPVDRKQLRRSSALRVRNSRIGWPRHHRGDVACGTSHPRPYGASTVRGTG